MKRTMYVGGLRKMENNSNIQAALAEIEKISMAMLKDSCKPLHRGTDNALHKTKIDNKINIFLCLFSEKTIFL